MTGEQRKADGMTLALTAAAEWAELAREGIDYLADRGAPFTSEDLTELVGLPRGKVGRDANNAVGAIVSGAARRGVIRRVGDVNAGRASSHAARLAVWEGARDDS